SPRITRSKGVVSDMRQASGISAAEASRSRAPCPPRARVEPQAFRREHRAMTDAPARLRAMLTPDRPAIAMSAHNPLSAKLATEAGFEAIWGSGFELSAAHAVPDASILSWDTHLAAMRE